MIRLLRSIIDFNEPSIEQSFLQRNFLVLIESKIKFKIKEEKEIFNFIRGFYFQEFNYDSSLPTFSTIKDFFIKEDRKEILSKLDEIERVPAYYKADFDHLLKELLNDQHRLDFTETLQEAALINAQGAKVEGNFLRGPKDATRFLYNRCGEYVTAGISSKLKLNARDSKAINSFFEKYEAIKNDPSLGMGRLIGLEKIDIICKGLRKGEMLLIAGFSGNMKTTLCLNYAYNTVIHFGYNVYYLTLEMSLEQVQRIFYCIHSEHPQFKLNPKYKEFYRKLDYKKIRDGELSSDEEAFLKIVLNDFETNPRYGNVVIEKPDTDITISDIQAKVEMEHRQNGIDLLFVDEVRLVNPHRKYGSTTESWNEVLKDLKQLALRFNGGEGLPIVSPFQTNRQGYREAEKNEGEYKADCLSYANEAERSSDVIIYTYLDPDLRDAQEIKIGNLKNRDNEIFKPFKARVIGHARRIENLDED